MLQIRTICLFYLFASQRADFQHLTGRTIQRQAVLLLKVSEPCRGMLVKALVSMLCKKHELKSWFKKKFTQILLLFFLFAVLGFLLRTSHL